MTTISLTLTELLARGVALCRQGNFAQAEHLYAAVLGADPRQFDALLNLGRIFVRRGRSADVEPAIDLLQRAIAVNKQIPEAHFELGQALALGGRLDQADQAYRQAIRLKPDYANAHSNLGRVLQMRGRFGEAADSYSAAVSLTPESAAAHNNLGDALLAAYRLDEAAVSFRRALALAPADSGIHYNLATTLRGQNNVDGAIEHFSRALELNPAMTAARFSRCIAQLPVLYHDEHEIAVRRAAYARCIEQLSDDAERGQVAGNLADGFGWSQPFYLAYQGQNDRALQARYGSLAYRAMAEICPPAALAAPAGPGDRVRLGIVSGFFHNHSNWKIPIKGWLSQLDRSKFQVFGYYTRGRIDRETEIAAGMCDRFVQGALSLAGWHEEICADAPHVLIYPEVGMDVGCGQLATQRLAPVQCASWGHPNTTGYPTIDYFLSSAGMEPPTAQAHYTERLVRLPNLSIYFEPLDYKPVALDRTGLGLRQAATVFWCGQSLFKYLPQHDQVFPRIARDVGDCQFVFIEADRHNVTTLFRRRLERAFGDFGLNVTDHCVMLSRLATNQFVAAIGQCDIVLDSIGWSGCNSTLEGLTHDVPIVTLRGDLMRGRHTMAILQMMGVTETITDTVDEYVSVAVRLARDPAWRQAVRRRIADNKHRVYRDRECIAALEDFLCRAARGEVIGDASPPPLVPAAASV